MPDLNLRDVDVTLVTLLKVAAAARGISLKKYVVQTLWFALQEGSHGKPSDVDGRAERTSEAGSVERSGNDATLPVLQPPQSSKKRLREVQPLRDELAGRGESGPGPESQPETHKGHRIFLTKSGKYCATCKLNF